MTKQLLNIPTAFICVILLLGCSSTSSLLISVLKPASVSIPGTIKRISVFPVAGIPEPPGVFDSLGYYVMLDPGFDYNKIKKGYLYGLYEALLSSPRFQKVVLADSVFADSVFSGIISWDLLKEICRHDSTDAVVLINKVVAYDSIQILEESGKKVRTPSLTEYPEEYDYYCTLFFRLISKTKWAFYQPAIQIRSAQYSFTDTTDLYCNSNCNGAYDTDSMQKILYSACFYTGKKVGEKLTPVWDEAARRYFYTGMDMNLRDAAKFVKQNQWNEAAQIWNSLSEDKSKRLASKASFNMALAWERADDLDQAFSWISYADSLFSNSKTLTYKKILKKRLETRDILDKQMTGN
jgi:hypothetical protein